MPALQVRAPANLGLVCLETDSVTLPDGYLVRTVKQLATEVNP